MPELSLAPTPAPETCRSLLRAALSSVVPGWQPLAEDLLGADARIDLAGVDANGRVWLVLLGLEPGGDMALVAAGLAQRAWVQARLDDWLQLAPGAGIDRDGEVEVLLLASEFRPAALAALEAQRGLRAARLRFVAEPGRETHAWIELCDAPAAEAPPRHAQNGGAQFRSGLSAEDLELSADEIAELRREP